MCAELVPAHPDFLNRAINDVVIERGSWIDATRERRQVPYKIYRPAVMEERSYKVIVWSHGLGGLCDGAAFLGRYMAQHGYIHVHIQHAGTDDVLWRAKPGHPWDAIRATPLSDDVICNRFADVAFVFDQLEFMYDGRLDMEHIGLCGHSFGALTTQVIAGQGTRYGDDFADERLCAGLVYSPIPSLDGADVYGDIAVPLLHMTGTQDDSPLDAWGYEKRLEVYEGVYKAPQHLCVIDGADHMVFAGSRGQLPAYANIAQHEGMICTLTHAWWEAMLNGNVRALAWLQGSGEQGCVQGWLGAQARYAHKG